MTLITSSNQLDEALEETLGHHIIAIDTETLKSERYGENSLVGIAWGFPVGSKFRAYYAPFRHKEDSLLDLTKNLPESDISKFSVLTEKDQVYHNAVFDLTVLLREGLDFTKTFIWDTMVMSHLCNENERSYSLDDLSLRYFKTRKKSLKALETQVGWDGIPAYLMSEYACTDVALTFRHFLRCRAILQSEEQIDLYEDSQRLLQTLRRVIDRGLTIDSSLAVELQGEARGRMAEIESQLGYSPSRTSLVRDYLHTTLGIPVLHRTKKGEPATDSPSLRDYSDQFPEASDYVLQVLEYRTLSKAVSTWYEGFLTKTDDQGRLHPGLVQTGTKTGRLSCKEPNLQQVPRDGTKANAKVRRLFRNSPAHVLYEFDYSQIELRLASWYSRQVGDDALFQAYANDNDVHTLTANKVGLIDALGHKLGRQVGKTVNFLLIYRGGAKRLRATLYNDANLRFPLTDCLRWREAYFESYPGITQCNEMAEEKARKFGYVTMWHGRKRRLYGNECHKAFNAVVQGGAAGIMTKSMVLLEEEMPDLLIVNQVHDSVWVELPIDRVDELSEQIIRTLRKIPEDRFEMPFTVEGKPLNATE